MDIYAFPLSPADIIRPETRAERIERMAAEALQEISHMADDARAEFAPPPLTMEQRSAAYVLEQLRGMQNDPNRFWLGAASAQPGTLSHLGLAQTQDRLQLFTRL